jgi:dolichol-phosphate mannosyltransferase
VKEWLQAQLTPSRLRFLRFAVVGGSGVVINEAVFAGVYHLGTTLSAPVRLNVAAVLGFCVSMVSNFFLNSAWTWGDRKRDPGLASLAARLGSYTAVALIALGVQLAVLNALVGFDLLPPLVANLVGIGAGTVVNFVVNNFWTFRDRGSA